MSTYNGEKYLRQQIDTILYQKGCDVRLLVRDDGSSDNTQNILEEYSKANKLQWYQGDNIKPARSFFDLLCKADECDFYAFADQDDYWLDDKLATACSKIGVTSSPSLYFSNTKLVNHKLENIPSKNITPLLSQGESVVYAFASGCTMVFNKALQKTLRENIPMEMPMLHDFWCYTVAQAIGAKIVYDKQSHILYRQHSNNVVGMGESFYTEWKKRFKRIFVEHANERSRNAAILLSTIGHLMTKDAKERTSLFVQGKTSLRKRIKLFLNSSFKCGSLKTWSLFKVAIILNTY